MQKKQSTWMAHFNLIIDLRYWALTGILVGVLLVQACSPPLKPESGCNFVQNSQYQRISWKGDKVELSIDSSVPSEYIASIESAAEIWNKKLNKNIFIVYKNSKAPQASVAKKDGHSIIYWRNSWDINKPGEQARTSVYWEGNRIQEADIQINAFNFRYFKTGDLIDYSRVHLESLIVHELGHVLGLAHTDHENSVMKTFLANGYIRDEPSQIDLSSLSCEYK